MAIAVEPRPIEVLTIAEHEKRMVREQRAYDNEFLVQVCSEVSTLACIGKMIDSGEYGDARRVVHDKLMSLTRRYEL